MGWILRTLASANVGGGPTLAAQRRETEVQRGAGRGRLEGGAAPRRSPHSPCEFPSPRNEERAGGPYEAKGWAPRGHACADWGVGGCPLRRGGGAPSPASRPRRFHRQPSPRRLRGTPDPSSPRARACAPPAARTSVPAVLNPSPAASFPPRPRPGPTSRQSGLPRPTWSPKKAECSRLSSPRSPMEPRSPDQPAPRPQPLAWGRQPGRAAPARRLRWGGDSGRGANEWTPGASQRRG